MRMFVCEREKGTLFTYSLQVSEKVQVNMFVYVCLKGVSIQYHAMSWMLRGNHKSNSIIISFHIKGLCWRC